MSAAPDLIRRYSVCVLCQWYCVLNAEPMGMVMVVGGVVVGGLRAEGGAKEKVDELGGGR